MADIVQHIEQRIIDICTEKSRLQLLLADAHIFNACCLFSAELSHHWGQCIDEVTCS